MRIMIAGAGATGGFLAVKLGQAGHDVSVVARGAHLEAIQSEGLNLSTPDGSTAVVDVPASNVPDELGPQDLVITTLKSPALPALMKDLRHLVDVGTPVVTAMNGVFWWYGQDFDGYRDPATSRLDPDGTLAKMFEGHLPLGMVIHSTNEVVSPGHVVNRSPKNRFVIGGPNPASSEKVRGLFDQVSATSTTFEITDNVRYFMWRKLLRNLTTAPISVLTGAKAFDVINDPYTSAVARELFSEGSAVASAHGFGGLADEVDTVFKPGGGADQKPSMSQDIDRGRPLEIDSILRIVQDFGQQAGVPTPALDHVVGLVILRARLANCYPPAAPGQT